MTVIDLIKKHEGVRLFPYTDTVGKLTIGVGRNLTDVGVSASEALAMLEHDLVRTEEGLSEAWPTYLQLDEVRKAAVLDMAFNLGVTGLLGFRNTLAAIASGDWQAASDGMRNSLWAKQVGGRSDDDADMMLTGQWPAP